MGRDRRSVKIDNVLLIVIVMVVIIPALARQSHAKDFGVVGHSYEIIEQDIIAYIKQRLEHQDFEAINRMMQEKARERFERPESVAGVVDAKEDREYYYDPTFVLDQDIKDHNGYLIYGKGKVINPLTKVSLTSALIFINGDRDEQVEYALNQYKDLDGKAKIILTSGSPIKLQKEQRKKSEKEEKKEKLEVWFYFDQFGFLTKKLGITAVPAVVKQAGLRLKINEVALK